MNKLTNRFLVPAVIILFISVVLGIFAVRSTFGTAEVVTVKQGDKIIEKISLGDVSEPYEIRLSGNTVLVEKDGVSMKGADCPDKCCVQMGKITRSNESIICLPNKVIVEIEGKKSDVDGIAGAR